MTILYLLAVFGLSWLALGAIRHVTEPAFETPNWLWLLPGLIGIWAVILILVLS